MGHMTVSSLSGPGRCSLVSYPVSGSRIPLTPGAECLCSPFVHRPAPDNGPQDRNILDAHRIRVMRILAQHDEICQLPRSDGPFQLLLE